MTLKEIEKLIDKSNLILIKNNEYIIPLSISVGSNKENLISVILHFINERKNFVYFYSFDERTGEMTLLAKIDHIDKEKKVVKKKIDDMSTEELYNLTKNFCAKHPKKECTGCPLWSQEKHCIGLYFNKYKRGYLEAKDKEFEIEVEGKWL